MTKKRTLTVKAPDGSIHSRTTATNYTHALLVYGPVAGVKRWFVPAWSSSEVLAKKQQARWRSAYSHHEQYLVVPVNPDEPAS